MSPGSDFQVEAYYDRTNHQEVNFGEDRNTFDIDLIAHTNVGARQQFIYGLGAQSSDGHFMEVVPAWCSILTTGSITNYPDFLKTILPSSTGA